MRARVETCSPVVAAHNELAPPRALRVAHPHVVLLHLAALHALCRAVDHATHVCILVTHVCNGGFEQFRELASACEFVAASCCSVCVLSKCRCLCCALPWRSRRDAGSDCCVRVQHMCQWVCSSRLPVFARRAHSSQAPPQKRGEPSTRCTLGSSLSARSLIFTRCVPNWVSTIPMAPISLLRGRSERELARTILRPPRPMCVCVCVGV